jgi:hypothetical protein
MAAALAGCVAARHAPRRPRRLRARAAAAARGRASRTYARSTASTGLSIADVSAEWSRPPAPAPALADSRGAPRADEIHVDPWRVVQEPSYDYPQVFEAPVPILPERLAAASARRWPPRTVVPDLPALRLAAAARGLALGARGRAAGQFDALLCSGASGSTTPTAGAAIRTAGTSPGTRRGEPLGAPRVERRVPRLGRRGG